MVFTVWIRRLDSGIKGSRIPMIPHINQQDIANPMSSGGDFQEVSQSREPHLMAESIRVCQEQRDWIWADGSEGNKRS